eukprot:10141972-Alexandrium_andersonii.AAC.1
MHSAAGGIWHCPKIEGSVSIHRIGALRRLSGAPWSSLELPGALQGSIAERSDLPDWNVMATWLLLPLGPAHRHSVVAPNTQRQNYNALLRRDNPG